VVHYNGYHKYHVLCVSHVAYGAAYPKYVHI